jgi:hypothetical protein
VATFFNRIFPPSVTNQPPTQAELRRNDIVVIVWFLFALLLGLGIRNRVLNASRIMALGENLPEISVPARWITGSDEDTVVYARNPRSPSTFDAQMSATVRDLNEGENLVLARTALGARRTQQYDRYRELFAEPVHVLDEVEGTLVTYAYVADPTRDSGAVAPPVVVQAQDLIFITDDKVVVVTTAADASEWEADQRDFDAIYNGLDLQFDDAEIEAVEIEPAETEAAGGEQ